MSQRPVGEPSVLDVRLVPAAVTSWAVTALGIVWSLGPALTVLFGLAALAVPLAHRGLDRWGVASGLLGVCVVGIGFSIAITVRSNGIGSHPIVTQFGSSVEVTVTPSESPRVVAGGRLLFRANLDRLGVTETGGRVVVFASGPGFGAVAAGTPMRFRAGISRPRRHDLTVATLTATGDPVLGTPSLLQRGAAMVRARFAAVAREALPADAAAMLPALVLGDTAAVPATTAQQFRTAGLTHLTAVSGANVTIVCGTVLFAARLVGPRVAVFAAALALAAFVVVVQPGASVLRAALMGVIALLGVLTARRRQAIPALAAAVLVLMIAAPQLAVDAGFALSVAATAGLVLLAPDWSRRLVTRGWPKPLADAVCVAITAQLVTAPLIAGLSGSFSLVSVGANLAVAPIVAPITVLGTLAALLAGCWAGAAQLLIRFTGPELWWLLGVAQWAAGVPGATVPVPPGTPGVLLVGGAAMLGGWLWRGRWRRPGLAAAAVCVVAWMISATIGGR